MTTVLIDRGVEIPMRDGVILRADVWRPSTPAKLPAIVFRSPYDRKNLSQDTLRPIQAVDSGYAVVVQDTRGRFESDGQWQVIMWGQEAVDTHDTVEWVAAQPWCDGQVAMAGTSYLGIVQWLGAMQQPPHLRAIAPCMTTSRELDIAETGGAFRLDHVLTWLVFMAADWLSKQIRAGTPPSAEVTAQVMKLAADPGSAMEVLPLRSEKLEIPGFPVSWSRLLDGDVEQVPDFDYGRVVVPVLSLGGWYDVFNRATVTSFRRLQTDGGGGGETRAAHRLVMGPWAHAGTLPNYQGELNFGISAAGPYSGIGQDHIAFFDTHLKGQHAEPPAVRYFLMQGGSWRSADSWPPSDASTHAWYLGRAAASGGWLTRDEAKVGESTSEFVYDPLDPVPTHGGRVLYLGRLVGGPFNQTHLESRSDVLTFTSEIVKEPIDVVGQVSCELTVASEAVDTDFVLKLTDVFPDGRSILVCDGALRTRYREGFDREVLLTPGQPASIRVDLGNTAWRYPPGHRIRLSVTSSNFPQLDRNLNNGAPVGMGSYPQPARQTVFHAGPGRSVLCLPVLAG